MKSGGLVDQSGPQRVESLTLRDFIAQHPVDCWISCHRREKCSGHAWVAQDQTRSVGAQCSSQDTFPWISE